MSEPEQFESLLLRVNFQVFWTGSGSTSLLDVCTASGGVPIGQPSFFRKRLRLSLASMSSPLTNTLHIMPVCGCRSHMPTMCNRRGVGWPVSNRSGLGNQWLVGRAQAIYTHAVLQADRKRCPCKAFRKCGPSRVLDLKGKITSKKVKFTTKVLVWLILAIQLQWAQSTHAKSTSCAAQPRKTAWDATAVMPARSYRPRLCFRAGSPDSCSANHTLALGIVLCCISSRGLMASDSSPHCPADSSTEPSPDKMSCSTGSCGSGSLKRLPAASLATCSAYSGSTYRATSQATSSHCGKPFCCPWPPVADTTMPRVPALPCS